MTDKVEDSLTFDVLRQEYNEAVGIFPALHKYKADHNADNLKKLCVEVASFCRSIYASTQSEQERTIYRDMLKKLN